MGYSKFLIFPHCGNHGNLPSLFFDKNFVKVMFFNKKKYKRVDLTKFFMGYSKFLIFPHCRESKSSFFHTVVQNIVEHLGIFHVKIGGLNCGRSYPAISVNNPTRLIITSNVCNGFTEKLSKVEVSQSGNCGNLL